MMRCLRDQCGARTHRWACSDAPTASRSSFDLRRSIILVPIGNVTSIHVPGEGRVYSNVGFTKLHITFPEEGDPIVELLADPGQHDDNEIEVICEVLGG